MASSALPSSPQSTPSAKRRKVIKHTPPQDLELPSWAPGYTHLEPVPAMVLKQDVLIMDATCLPTVTIDNTSTPSQNDVRQMLTQVSRPNRNGTVSLRRSPRLRGKSTGHANAHDTNGRSPTRKHGRPEGKETPNGMNQRPTKRRRLSGGEEEGLSTQLNSKLSDHKDMTDSNDENSDQNSTPPEEPVKDSARTIGRQALLALGARPTGDTPAPDNITVAQSRQRIGACYKVRNKILADSSNIDAFRFVKHTQSYCPPPDADPTAASYGLGHRQNQPQFKHPPTLPLGPADGRKPTLVLDLDETLVHSNVEPVENVDYQFGVNFSGAVYQVFVRKRPFVDEFLRRAAEWYDIVLFTASQAVYADKVLEHLTKDVGKDVFSHRLYRNDCTMADGNYMKDLTILDRPLETTVLVDNSPSCFGFQVENGIPIVSWFDREDDRELLDLLVFLDHLRHVPDVRPVLKDKFDFQSFIEDCPEW